MTTGTVDLNRSPFSRYTKNWSGTNYPSTPPLGIFQAVWYKVDRAIDSQVPGSPPTVGWTYLRKWEERKKKRRSLLVDHPYHMDLEFWTDTTQGKVAVYNQYPPYNLQGYEEWYFRTLYNAGYNSRFPLLWGANDTIALQGKLREKIVGSDFDMGVFLGEGRQTLMLLAQTATRLLSAMRSLRGCDPGGVAKALGLSPARVRDIMRKNPGGKRLSPKEASVAASSAWLELQYGWIPLVSDAFGAAQALAQQLNEPAVQTYRVRKRNQTKTCPVASPNIKSYEYLAQVKGQLIARLTEKNVIGLNGLADPSSVLWELLPWSFVADWFIPIGSYLEARGLAQSLSGVFVTTITQRETFSTTSGLPLSAIRKRERDFNYRHMRVIVDRTVSSSLATPFPTFKPLDKVASWKRAANAVALLTVGFAGGRTAVSPAWFRPERKFRTNMAW